MNEQRSMRSAINAMVWELVQMSGKKVIYMDGPFGLTIESGEAMEL